MTAKKTIWAALLAAQAEFKPLRETGRNPHFRSSYATLGDIRSATNEALAHHGLAVTQAPVQMDGNISVVSRIVHVETGEIIEDSCPVLGNVQDMQKLGSAITYARRYLLLSQLNLASSELDDDGEANGAQAQQPVKSSPSPSENGNGERTPARLSSGQLKRLHAVGTEFYGDAWDEKRPALVEVVTKGEERSAAELTPKEAATLIHGLERRIEEREQKREQVKKDIPF